MNMLRAELVKLARPRMIAGIMGAMVVMGVLATVLTMSLTTADASSFNRDRPGAVSLSLAQLAHADGATRGFLVGAGFVGVLMLATFAVSFANEFGTGTIRNLVLLEPRRLRVLSGKFVALLAFAAVGFLLAEIASIGAAVIVAGMRGIPMHEWATLDGVRSVISAYGNALLLAAGWGLLGAFVAVIFRSLAVSLGIALAWFFPFENILHNAWSTSDSWFPGLLLQGIGAGTGGAVSWSRAVAVFAAYAVVLGGIAAATFVRRDVTS